MRASVNSGLLVWALCVTAFIAMGVGIPHVFVPNTTASATEMNANFSALKAAVDALESPNRPGTILLFGRISGSAHDSSFLPGTYASTGFAPPVTHVAVGTWEFPLPNGVTFDPVSHLVLVTPDAVGRLAEVSVSDTNGVRIMISDPAVGFRFDEDFQVVVIHANIGPF